MNKPLPNPDAHDRTDRRIPRVIHQVFLSGQLSPELQANVDRLIALNPGYEHRLYDATRAEAFIAEHYGPEMLATYLRIDPDYAAARADLLRHLIIHHSGGIYADIKSTFDRPLDDVVRPDDQYVLAQWRNGPGQPNEGWGIHRDLAHIWGGEFITYFIIGVPRHPFSAAVISRISSNIRSYRPWNAVGKTGVLRTTGPIAYSLAIHPIRGSHPHRFASEEELGARPSIGDGYNHLSVFKKHYSQLSSPVVTLSPIGRRLNRWFVALRELKHRHRARNGQSQS